MENTYTGSNPSAENHRGDAAKICSGEGGETQITLKNQTKKNPKSDQESGDSTGERR